MDTKIRAAADPLALPPLTAKQREVMALVADNRTSKEIAGLLGISESAVNQRIELIRARLGGIPRGEMARLYRQQFMQEPPTAPNYPQTWEKIQVQLTTSDGQSENVEGPSGATTAPLQSGKTGSGSQPSRWLLPAGLAWLGREEFYATFVRFVLIGTLGLAGVAAAAAITQFVGLSTGS